MKLQKGRNLLSLLSLVGLGFACLALYHRYSWLVSVEYPISTDAYYYLQELRQRLTTGKGYYTDTSVFFFLWALVTSLLSITPETSYQLLVASGYLFFALGIGGIAFSLRRPWLAVSLLLLFFYSDVLFFRHYAFPKQALSIGVLSLGIACWLRANSSRVIQMIGVSLLVLAATFHFFGAVLALLFLLIVARQRVFNVRTRVFMTACGVGFVSWYLQQNPKEIIELGFDRAWIGWVDACDFARCSDFEWLEFIVYSLLWVACSFVLLIYRAFTPAQTLLFTLVLILNLPIWAVQGHMAYRLAYSSVWVSLIFLAMHNLEAPEGSQKSILSALVALAAVSVVAFYHFLPHKVYQDRGPSIRLMREMSDQVQSFVEPEALIIAPHGIQFRVSYFWKRRSSKEHSPSSSIEVYRLSFVGKNDRRCLRQKLKNCLYIGEGWQLTKQKEFLE